MFELYRTNNPVELSYLRSLLNAANVEFVIVDQHASIVEGSIGAIQQRVLVSEEDKATAEAALSQLDATEHDD